LLGRSFGAESANEIFLIFVTVSELRRFCVDVAFIIVVVGFYKMGTTGFNVSVDLLV
jgi:hypothetical protein